MQQSEPTKHHAECIKCERTFVYELPPGKVRRREREFCPACLWEQVKKRKQKYKVQNHLVRAKGEVDLRKLKGAKWGVIRAPVAKIAKAMKIKVHEVEELERQALAKIRNNPELKKVWSTFKEENNGGSFEGLLANPTEQGLRLLEYQMSVLEFWETHDQLLEVDPTTASQCMQEIKNFQSTIAAAVEKI